jgi:hypothetical protein
VTFVNSNGIANDPSDRVYLFGENTMPKTRGQFLLMQVLQALGQLKSPVSKQIAFRAMLKELRKHIKRPSLVLRTPFRTNDLAGRRRKLPKPAAAIIVPIAVYDPSRPSVQRWCKACPEQCPDWIKAG